MGGGDLNLKKSWHPCTMKNVEKVRKAEQQNHQENKRIAELKREIEIEKDREDIKKYAMEQGVIEKKDDKKLDWMYKGPNQVVNREEYLLGKPVDKAFEQIQQAEKDAELNRIPKNHVEYECIPPSLRFFSGNEQVDLARKIQEDPLFAIKKKEMETRNLLLKNPVKLKQLKELLEQQTCKSKSEKKRKSKQKDSSEDEDKLDTLLATKYKQLKDNISEKNLLKSMKKMKHKQMKKSMKYCHESEADSSSDDTCIKKKRHKRQKKQKRNASDSESTDNNSSKSVTKREREDNIKERGKYSRNNSKIDDSKKQIRKRKLSEDRNSKYERSIEEYREKYNTNNKRQRYEGSNKQRDDSKNKYNDKRRYSMEKQHDTMISNSGKLSAIESTSDTGHTKFMNRKEEKYKSKARPRLTEEEKEQRRKEMMANAVWRDKEREKNVKIYREQHKKEEQNNTSFDRDFIRKQLIAVTEVDSVASRIKAKINNIQRSGRAMDTNFAKR